MIDSLRELCDVLAKPELSAEAAAEAIGTVTETNQLSIEVQPRASGFASATIVRAPDERGFSHVELSLEEPVGLDELAKAFGAPATPPRLHAGSAERRVYRVSDCRLIASLGEEGRVEAITLQPDVA